MLQRIVPVALKHAKPGSPEFRKALRDALESERDIVVSHGVLNYTAQDHFGFDESRPGDADHRQWQPGSC